MKMNGPDVRNSACGFVLRIYMLRFFHSFNLFYGTSYILREKKETRGVVVKEHLHVNDEWIHALHKEKSPVVTYTK